MTVAAPASSALHFELESHTYSLNGRRLISVTQALHEAGLINDDWYTDFGRQRGQWVHQALEWLDKGTLEEPADDNPLAGYLKGYRRFCYETGAQWDFVELRLYDEARGLAGTLDRAGTVNGHVAVLDFKTGAPEPWHAVQIMAYTDLVRLAGYYDQPLLRRYGLYLTADGTYKLIEYTDRRDRAVFDAALLIAQWHRAHPR